MEGRACMAIGSFSDPPWDATDTFCLAGLSYWLDTNI